ncbi:hypothetical protein DPMN_142534 [Dreissena polymorpha]|uniref:Uncharacterized protein n=1 Tax=Dreissena polymorpha TaxID=45954 RepID=A0A9D4JIR6_DREPO|nr:hypothetical protein DPMN_142534 [Dreissena polymorpha]
MMSKKLNRASTDTYRLKYFNFVTKTETKRAVTITTLLLVGKETPEVRFHLTAQVFSVVGDAFGMVASRIKSLNTFVLKFFRFLATVALQQMNKSFSNKSLTCSYSLIFPVGF